MSKCENLDHFNLSQKSSDFMRGEMPPPSKPVCNKSYDTPDAIFTAHTVVK